MVWILPSKRAIKNCREQVNALVKTVDEVGKGIDFGDAKDFDDVYNAIMKDKAARLIYYTGQLMTSIGPSMYLTRSGIMVSLIGLWVINLMLPLRPARLAVRST